MKERIGLFGGTFDPVHSGHLRAAAEVRKRFSLKKILFIPSFIPPHKNGRASASPWDRFRMVELACRQDPFFEASSVEVEAGEKSYSILTLKKVKRIYPGTWLFFLLGVDAFLEIETWREHEKVLEECLFIVMARPGFRFSQADQVLGEEKKGWIRRLSNKGKPNDNMFATHRIFFLPIASPDISSTEVRKKIGAGESVKDLVPADVERYIHAHRLYQGA